MLSTIDQNAVALRLATEARTGRANGYWKLLLLRVSEDPGDLFDGSRRYHHLWEHPVGTRIRRVLDEIDDSRMHLCVAQDFNKVITQPQRSAHRQLFRSTVVGWSMVGWSNSRG